MGGQNLVLHKPWRGAQCLVGTGQVTGRAWRKAVGIGRSEGRLRIKSLQGVGSSPQGGHQTSLGVSRLRGAGGISPAPWLPGKAKQELRVQMEDLVQEPRGAQEALQAPEGL